MALGEVMDGSAEVRLVFAGQLVSGFSIEQVKRSFAQAFQVDGPRLDGVFAGGRTTIKRGIARAEVDRYVQKLRAMGMEVMVEPMNGAAPPPPPSPVQPPASVPAPPPAALPPLTLLEEQIVCPNCGERQSKRVLCRSCSTDIQRALANKQEELDRARAERLAARQGDRYAAPKAAGAVLYEATDELPPVWSLSFEGRMGRIAYFNTGLLSMLAIGLVGVGLAVLLPLFRSFALLIPVGLFFAALMVWAMRVSALRLHDMNRSGWWSAVLLVPYVGSLVSLAMMFWPGTEGDNDYGPQPRQGNALVAIVIGALVGLMLVTSVFSYRSYVKRAARAEAPSTEQFDPNSAQAADMIAGPAALKAFNEEYLQQPSHKAFASSDSGAFGWRSGQGSPREAARQALAACDANRQPYTDACKLVNINGQWLMQK